MKLYKWPIAIGTGILLALGAASAANAKGLQDDVDQATTVIERFRAMPEQGIPEAVLRDAKGIAILTVLKAGFIFSGQGGWGVVVARAPHGWSGPSAIGTGGAGFGFQVGAEVTEYVMVLNTPEDGEERGVVINISSGAAYEAQIGQCAYAASKAALIGLNSPAARELGSVGVRVNAIAPGLFLTPMVKTLDQAVIDSLVGQIEAPKRLGDMREFAHGCAFIIENAYLNGETVRLDAASRLRAR